MTNVTHPAVRREAREIFRGVDMIKSRGKSGRWHLTLSAASGRHKSSLDAPAESFFPAPSREMNAPAGWDE
jgi:hypothetical protein